MSEYVCVCECVCVGGEGGGGIGKVRDEVGEGEMLRGEEDVGGGGV